MRGRGFRASSTVAVLEASGSREFELRIPCTSEDLVLVGFAGQEGSRFGSSSRPWGASQLLVVGEAWREAGAGLRLGIDVPLARNPSDEVELKVACSPAWAARREVVGGKKRGVWVSSAEKVTWAGGPPPRASRRAT